MRHQPYTQNYRLLRKAGKRKGGPPQRKAYQLVVYSVKQSALKTYIQEALFGLNRLYLGKHMESHTVTYMQ